MARAPRKNKPEAGDFSGYLEKGPTDLQARFTDWLQGDAVGYNPASAKTKAEAFAEGVRLATALRMKFQASPENQEELEARRAAKEERQAKAAKRKTSGRKTRKAKAEEEPEPEELEDDEEELEDDEEAEEPEAEEEEPEEKPKPVRRTRKASTTAKTSSGTARTTRRTRGKAKSEAAPF